MKIRVTAFDADGRVDNAMYVDDEAATMDRAAEAVRTLQLGYLTRGIMPNSCLLEAAGELPRLVVARPL